MDPLADRITRTEELLPAACRIREQLMRDPRRPAYHFTAPSGWMNDINGAIFWQGRYHVFYQAYPDAAYWRDIQWGHASSLDLLHWVHHPRVLIPEPGGPDREGVFSGVAVLHDGLPTLVYHGVPGGTCLATSDDPDLLTWTRHPANPVIPVPGPEHPDHGRYSVFDPCAWQQGDTWYLLCGGTHPAGRDTAFLFSSPDMVNWEPLGPFYEPRPEWTERGEDCAVPGFFPLGRRHMLLFVSHKYGCQYYLGSYRKGRFEPQAHARMNFPGGQLIAPMTMLDPRGRRLMFGWACEARRVDASRADGWSGVMTLPRVLSLAADGSLRIEPLPELQALRRSPFSAPGRGLQPDREYVVEGLRGDCLEIAAEFEPGRRGQVGLAVRCAPGEQERTEILYDPARHTLSIDTSRASLDPSVVRPWPCPWGVGHPDPLETRVLPFHTEPSPISDVPVQTAPLELGPDEPLRLRVFLDRSILEVFANDRQCLTQRLYPTRPDSLGVSIIARAARASLTSLDAWQMSPTND